MKTLQLGLDGIEPSLVEKFSLPNIESVGKGFEISTHGNSGPSWVSCLTGLQPDGHGIYSLRPEQTRNSWQGIPIWEKVNGYSGIANIPITYPPDTDIDGWMVTGLMTPSRSIYTHPVDLYRELDEMGYQIDVWIEKHDNHPNGHFGTIPFDFTQDYREELLDRFRVVLEKRGDAFAWLLSEYTPVDFSFLVFTSLDRVQHLAFDDEDTIEEFYLLLDEQVGKVLDVLPSGVEVFLNSDHGFQRIDVPNSDLTGEHAMTGYGATNTEETFQNLEQLHRRVVESANRSDVERRLLDLGYIE